MPGAGAPVAEHALLDQKHGILDRRSAFHLAALDRGGVHHPHFPVTSTGVEERPIARIF
jgi:hypothetical protein